MDYRSKRRIFKNAVVLLFFAIPFIRVKGKSLLLFDVSDLTIHFLLRELKVDYVFSILLGIFAILFFFIYLTQIFGRLWCGWLCPQTIFLSSLPKLRKFNKKPWRIFFLAIISMLFILGIMMYFITPYELLPKLAKGDLHPVWLILFAIVFVELAFIGRQFCKTICPYAMFQSVMYDDDTMRVGMHEARRDECIQCDACVASCPTDIDIREGLNNKCIACAECVDACTVSMQSVDAPTLIDYHFGRYKLKPFNANKIIVLGLAILFTLFTIITSLGNRGVSVSTNSLISEEVLLLDVSDAMIAPDELGAYNNYEIDRIKSKESVKGFVYKVRLIIKNPYKNDILMILKPTKKDRKYKISIDYISDNYKKEKRDGHGYVLSAGDSVEVIVKVKSVESLEMVQLDLGIYQGRVEEHKDIFIRLR